MREETFSVTCYPTTSIKINGGMRCWELCNSPTHSNLIPMCHWRDGSNTMWLMAIKRWQSACDKPKLVQGHTSNLLPLGAWPKVTNLMPVILTFVDVNGLFWTLKGQECQWKYELLSSWINSATLRPNGKKILCHRYVFCTIISLSLLFKLLIVQTIFRHGEIAESFESK